ncbi:hypothetical protein ACSMXN_10105 [Jatrophihabitans sp. DSM 45814]
MFPLAETVTEAWQDGVGELPPHDIDQYGIDQYGIDQYGICGSY